MILGRKLIAGTAGVAAALALAACGTSSGKGLVEHPSITLGYNGPVVSLWQGTSEQYSTYNGNVALLTNLGFNYYGMENGAPKLLPNTNFGTYSKTSDSPLTVKLHVNQGVTWSDGTQVNTADILLSWASGLTKYNDPKGAVNFDSVGPYAGVGLDTLNTPTVDPNGLDMTVSFKQPYVDWEIAVGSTVSGLSPGLPAHIVYELANPGFKGTAAQADAAVTKAILAGDTGVISKLANAWHNDWNVTQLPKDKRLLVSEGPYVVSAYSPTSISFTRRDDYTGAPSKATVDQITIRDIEDPTAQVQALQNKEVQVIQGQPTADTVTAVKALTGVHVDAFGGATYEHVDLNMGATGGAFNPATYGGDKQKALLIRQAFLKALPRQEIIDKLVKPINSNATLDDSNLFIPGSDGYNKSVEGNGAKAYDAVDIAGAKALLQQAGVTNPTVRFTYPTENTRRSQEYQLIQASEAKAGFKVVSAAQPQATYFSNLVGGPYDASIFAWQFTSTGYTGNMPAYVTKGGENFNSYSNPESDALWKQIAGSTGSADATNALMAQVDKNLISDAATIPIFQFPEVVAWQDNLEGLQDNPIANGSNVLWNPWDWKVTK